MANYDVFNGDADGICSLVQLRLANPQNSILITGVKRDIELVAKVKPQPGDHLTVLDLSLEKNAEAVKMALEAGEPYSTQTITAPVTSLITLTSVCTSILNQTPAQA